MQVNNRNPLKNRFIKWQETDKEPERLTLFKMYQKTTSDDHLKLLHAYAPTQEKNSIRDASKPQPGKIVFITMRYRSSKQYKIGILPEQCPLYKGPNNVK